MSCFVKGDKVRFVKQPESMIIPVSRLEEAYVIDFSDAGDPIVEFKYKFLKHMTVVDEGDINAYT
jgi:uncharacterized membrane protein